ncbi:tetrapyrrole methylase family protein/MazG family protein [Gracilibacillus halotolerans]|uniref:Tetrapyrrole methylase family protein/MazG family protein n=1 Tax=Gracilibacillus halotolerans TaxID=74386 RepID=A0A841RTY6_9BACI|nr:nucleoside triphosphate pyrophosphohydrolase [Gracilibacillus halotolerans]MBB6513968.1 tetrapyrrole methylase family protein/MazG family protein [Gracilibacillus halotolerans]
MQKPLIEIIGLGGGDIEQLPLGIYRKLQNKERPLFVRTMEHPVLYELVEQEDIEYRSFDAIYEKHDRFEEVYEEIVQTLKEEAALHQHIRYAVPGHPMIAEKTVQLLLQEEAIDIEIVGGQSFLDDLFTAVQVDPIEGFQLVDATSFDRYELEYSQPIIFCQVYDQMIASEVKLALLEDLPADYRISIIQAAGSRDENILEVSLEELDRQTSLSNLTSVYIPKVPSELLNHQFYQLKEIIATLRGPNGCPWDRKQTHASLKKYLIEETYEVLEAIDREDDDAIAEELGDVLLQVMLHSQIGEDNGYFSIDDVIRHLSEKMIRRHPHVFGDAVVRDEEELSKTWEQIKRQENAEEKATSILDSLTEGLPATLLAEEVQKKAAKVGFDWKEIEPMMEKVAEELQEFKEAVNQENHEEKEKEFGDILFAMMNVARYYKINPETALVRTIHKFKNRFRYVEKCVQQSKQPWESFTLSELDQFWEEAKGLEIKE